VTAEDFKRAIAESHRALDEIARGDPSAFFELYSRGDDATLANPFGLPPAVESRSRRQVEEPHRTTVTAGPSSSRTSQSW
jgi:hypothetical protein